jgi:L-lactate dehydrogenase complex protein LldG
MSEAREQILKRIHAALGRTDTMLPKLPAQWSSDYRRTGTLDWAGRVELFVDRLHDYGAVVRHTDENGIGNQIREALRERNKMRLLVPAAVPPSWLPGEFQFVRDHNLSYSEIDRSEGVLTGCALAIALSGSIILRHTPEEGRRALTLIPDYHLCVVHQNQIVGTVPEAVAQMAAFTATPITTIAGPSATSDIEMTRIKGVHGPRTLDVILVG